MGWRDAYRLSDTAFTELSLQAIYAFRQGNILPGGSPDDLVPRARRRVTQSKTMVAGLLALLTLGAAFALNNATFITARLLVYSLSAPAFDTGVLTALLSLDVAFLWWTGLQILPSLISSGVLPVLEPLPLDDATLRRVAAIVYFRLFDLPVITILVVTPLFVGAALGVAAGLAILPGVFAAVAFALALSLLTGRFFVRRVQGARGGGGSTLLRWTYLVLWVIPAFAMFGFVTLAPAFFSALAQVTAAAPSSQFNLLLLAFPFSLASLPALAGGGTSALPLGTEGLLVLFAAAAGYVLLAGASVAWLGAAVRRVGTAPAGVATIAPLTRFGLHVTGSVRSVLVKDLRIASRTPGYAFLILLPILDSLALGLLTYAPGSSTRGAESLALGAVTSAALLATFFGPAFFAIEVLAYSYGRTLPLSDRSLVLGKVALVVAIYLVSAGVVLSLVDVRLLDPALFIGFVLAELPAVAAATVLELGLVLRRAAKKGLPVVNLYAGTWTAILISIPGLAVVAIPLAAFSFTESSSTALALGVMAAISVVELLACVPVLFARGSS
jgi:predicted permease